jgi:hypothetical protein
MYNVSPWYSKHVHTRVFLSHNPHGNGESMTRFVACADIVEDRIPRDEDHVAR